MGIDQGKTGNVNVIGNIAKANNKTPDEIGTTTFRSPFSPVDFDQLLAAKWRDSAALSAYANNPVEQGPGAVMYEAGARWQRPGYFPIDGGNVQCDQCRS